MNGDDDPDAVLRSSGLSRREAVALGLGAVASTAGCATFRSSSPEDEGDQQSSTPSEGEGTQRSPGTVDPDHALDPEDVDMGATLFLGFDDSEIELNIRGFAGSTFDGPFRGTIRVYSVPHRESIGSSDPEFIASSRRLLAEREVSQEAMRSTHAFDLDFPEGYAQRFVVTAAVREPAALDEHVVHRSNSIYLPFTNEARGERVLREIDSNRPSEDGWRDGNQTVNAVEFWFDEPEESPFDVPGVDESQYDPDWYRYRDLTVTAVVRFATYDSAIGDPDLPVFEWLAFSFRMSEWELLEAFRWNSIATQELEYGTRTYATGQDESEPIDDYAEFGSLMSSTGRKIYTEQYPEATDSPTPYEMYRLRRYRSGDRNNQMSPLYFAGGRPLSRRIARALESALDNPSFTALSNQPYYKATALKAFVGVGVPYSFNFNQGNYNMAPEEIVANWYLNATQGASIGADCEDAAIFFCGVAVHLLEEPVGHVSIPSAAHAMACVFDLDLSHEKPLQHPVGWVNNFGAYDTRFGEATLVECTRGPSTIGYRPTLDLSEMEARSRYTECPVLSHLPLNDDDEPHVDGTIRAPAAEPENPFTYATAHDTVTEYERPS